MPEQNRLLSFSPVSSNSKLWPLAESELKAEQGSRTEGGTGVEIDHGTGIRIKSLTENRIKNSTGIRIENEAAIGNEARRIDIMEEGFRSMSMRAKTANGKLDVGARRAGTRPVRPTAELIKGGGALTPRPARRTPDPILMGRAHLIPLSV
ncbi:hypothetical protein EVAR_94266_1 [Eumeta japonica]|uniref:Uncharacterized protein n=1 Tax=Eumeta variegata TaxID=151549 RepID=A0A4C1UG65_EUMVA|nr:hypothetical protein EVAR_94266_1 [Eumeta japonica]